MKAILVTHRVEYRGDTPFPPIGSMGYVLAGPDQDGDYDILFTGFPCLAGEPSWVAHRTMLVFIDDSQNMGKSGSSTTAA